MASDPISALIGGISSMITSGMNGAFASAANRQSFKYSLRLQKQQQEWQERMANTAHQRQVADMRAAGLNPVLSATGGSGAAVPSGSSATINAEPIRVADPVEAAIKAMKADKEMENVEANTKAADSQAKKNDADAELSRANAAKAKAETEIARAKAIPATASRNLFESIRDFIPDALLKRNTFIPAPSPAARQRMKEVAKEQKEFNDIIKQVPKKSLVIPRQEFDKLNNQGEYKPDYSKGYVDLKTGYRHLPDGSTVIPVDRQKILRQLKERERKRKK